MAQIQINEISQNYTYNIGTNSFATVALPITSCWGPGYVDPNTVSKSGEDVLESTTWNKFPATQKGMEAFVSTYRGPSSIYKVAQDYSYQMAMTLLAAGYDILTCRLCPGTHAEWKGYLHHSRLPDRIPMNAKATQTKTVEGQTQTVKADITVIAYNTREKDSNNQDIWKFENPARPEGFQVGSVKVIFHLLGSDIVVDTEVKSENDQQYIDLQWDSDSTLANSLAHSARTASHMSLFTIKAKYPGTFGNQLQVAARCTAQGYWNVVIYVVDTVSGVKTAQENLLFTFDIDSATDSVPYIEDVVSNFVEFSWESEIAGRVGTIDGIYRPRTSDEPAQYALDIFRAVGDRRTCYPVELSGGTDTAESDSASMANIQALVNARYGIDSNHPYKNLWNSSADQSEVLITSLTSSESGSGRHTLGTVDFTNYTNVRFEMTSTNTQYGFNRLYINNTDHYFGDTSSRSGKLDGTESYTDVTGLSDVLFEYQGHPTTTITFYGVRAGGGEDNIHISPDMLPIVYHREWLFTSACRVYDLLTDKLTYAPQRIISPGWDDLEYKFIDAEIPTTKASDFGVSALHTKLMEVAYKSRCATALLDIPKDLPKALVYNDDAADDTKQGYAQLLARISPSMDTFDVNGSLYTTHAALFAPWGQYRYVSTNKQSAASPAFLALMIQRAMILNQTLQYEWALPTNRKHGLKVGKLDYVVKWKELNTWQKLEGVGVNIITELPDLGTCLWGNSTLYEVPPATYQALANLSTRYLVNAVENVVYRCGVSITFQYNNDQAYNKFYAGVTPTLDTMRNVGAIDDYYVKMSADIDGLDQVNANTVIGKIYLIINGVINDIVVDLIALPPGVDLTQV